MIAHLPAAETKVKSETNRFVLKTIYQNGPLSRAGIARKTGLTAPTVSAAVAKLIEKGLVGESEPVSNGRGKPASQIYLIDGAFPFLESI